MKKYLTLFCLGAALSASAQKFDNLAPTPPMGWNSWNKFGCDINEQRIRGAADALVNSGMKKAGYTYIVIDDCWQVGRDSLGFIIADPLRFPSGIRALADYIHSKGLKFGIYTCAGSQTCAKRPGSRGHEYQDALQYAKWGVDYLKEDWCNTDGQNARESYMLMRDALYAAKRPILLSLCEWGLSKPWEWAADVAQLWRTTGDIQNNWNIADAKDGKCWAGGVVINLDMQQGLEKWAGPNRWNDPDMLEVGNGALTASESRAHFSLWCMLAAPLMAGNDIARMDAFTQSLLTNADAISIDQDPLGRQGYKIKDYGEFEIFYRPLADGGAALCLFNRFGEPIQVSLDWQTLDCQFRKNGKPMPLMAHIDRKDIAMTQRHAIRDIWSNKDIDPKQRLFTVTLPAHDVVLLKIISH